MKERKQIEDTAKEKIYQAVIELVSETELIESITSRMIAKRANVNLALINYYYHSKENLLSMVAVAKMESIIEQILKESRPEDNASERLKNLLVKTADFSFRYNVIFKTAVVKELKEGCKNSCGLIIPFLSELFPKKTEVELKIMALQLMLLFHQIVLYPEIYGSYLQTDFFNDKKRGDLICAMTDAILMRI